jgi:hypothetical protein
MHETCIAPMRHRCTIEVRGLGPLAPLRRTKIGARGIRSVRRLRWTQSSSAQRAQIGPVISQPEYAVPSQRTDAERIATYCNVSKNRGYEVSTFPARTNEKRPPFHKREERAISGFGLGGVRSIQLSYGDRISLSAQFISGCAATSAVSFQGRQSCRPINDERPAQVVFA